MQDMVKVIRDLSHRHSPYRVYSDFVEMSAIAFSNAVDKPQFEKREQRYFDIIKGYTKEELNTFPKMLGMLTQHLEAGFNDVLGNVYHELELHNERAGQYFTPYPICQMMAKLQANEGLHEIIAKKGFVSANDPACGSGAMIIALADEMYQQHVNYQQQLHVTVTDLDPHCVHMAYVQFSLLNIPGVVVHGNSLSLEEYSHWHTPAHIMGGWEGKLARRAKNEDFLKTASEIITQTKDSTAQDRTHVPEKIAVPESKPIQAGTQLKLF